MPGLTVIAEQALAPVPGGTGRYVTQICTALAQSAPAGWSVRSVTAWHRDTAAAAIAGVDGPDRLPAGRRALAALWQKGLPPWPSGESVHATTPLAPARRGAPLVAMVHDAVPWTHPETLTERGVRWHKAMVARLARNADALITPTEAVADTLRELFPAAAGRIRAVLHGVASLPVPPDAARRRDSLGLPPRYAMTIATLEPRKGLDTVIDSVSSPLVGDVALVVVGQPGWGNVNLMDVARRAGLSAERLIATGRLTDADLAAVLDGATLVVVPSRAEGFGMPVLEAMAAGVPVVHTDVPALVEVAGSAGRSVPVGDVPAMTEAIAEVASDADLALVMSDKGHNRAAQFSWRLSAERLWTVHLELVGRSS